MIASLDFGSSLTKALVFDGSEFRIFKFSLSYSPQQFSRKNVLESIRILQSLSGCQLIDSGNRPLYKIYVSTALPLSEESVEGTQPYQTLSSSKVLSSWELPVLDYGYQFIRFRDRVSVQNFDASQVLRWLPFKSTLAEIENYVDNRKIYSNVLPIFPRDLYIEQAMARESIIQFMRGQNSLDSFAEIVISGSIFGTNPFLSQSLLILLDSISFAEKLDVYLDAQSCVAVLGLLKLVEPEVYDEVPGFLRPKFLGTVLRFNGDAQVTIDLGLEKPLDVSVGSGSLFLFPLRAGETADVGVVLTGRKEKRFKICGGELGFLIDCRSFPLVLPTDAQRRIGLLKEWEKSIGATGRIHEI